MKKIFVLVMAVIFLGSLSTPSFALLRSDKGMLKGKIIAADPKKGQISVLDRSTGKTMVYMVKKPYYANFAPGTDVAVIVDLKTGVATQVTPLRKGR